ncbi:expressed unknown protein [Seminavis robusta]|uniref:SGNH/GDSL hydrolase family protein n=1 Tax=Seminavis robusta TaxID=568900 RepID=A0A9N8HSD0_9STRA|nr:expressed unknown protein [Seminavis robusta]|eukprot:Sro1370_g266990.1 n/a (324) ;mRNA; r:9909-10880
MRLLNNRVLAILGLACLALALQTTLLLRTAPNPAQRSTSIPQEEKIIRYASVGNSMLSWSNFQRILEQVFLAAGYKVQRDSYLRLGCSLSSLYYGWFNQLETIFSYIGWTNLQGVFVNNEQWDFIMFNDRTQWPARDESRQETVGVLKEIYAPLLMDHQPQAIPIFLQTMAHKEPNISFSEDLGDFDEFSQRLIDGIALYKRTLDKLLGRDPDSNDATRIAPMGRAYIIGRKKYPELWETMYSEDGFHMSQKGAVLQSFLMFWTITGEAPPPYDPTWWDFLTRRQYQRSDLPNEEEAALLYEVAQSAYEEQLKQQQQPQRPPP